MAGRGRGRGRASMSFNVETLGFGRGEALPGPLLQPPPVFPPLELKPVPLCSGEEYEYLLALKQEYRGTMRESPYYISAVEKKHDIHRYSDKYQLGQQDNSNNWEPDWSRLPLELRRRIPQNRKSQVKAVLKPIIPLSSTRNEAGSSKETIEKTLEALEKKEDEDKTGEEKEEESEEKKEEEGEGPEGDEDDYYDDEEMEEETDYNLNYFDNGEEFGMDDEDDNLDDGAVY